VKDRSIYLFSLSSHPHAFYVNSLTITFFRPNIDFFQYDYLIITSKQAVKALRQYNKSDYITKPALCISKQSAKSFEELGGSVLAVSRGYGDNLAEYIKRYPKDTKWLYLRAKVIASDFATLCREDGYKVDEKTVYASACSQEILHVTVEKNAILIFTSPSSVRCFLKNHKLLDSQKIIVIGKTTAQALPKECRYTLADETTLESCMQIAASLK